jgi:hypothetical protein
VKERSRNSVSPAALAGEVLGPHSRQLHAPAHPAAFTTAVLEPFQTSSGPPRKRLYHFWLRRAPRRPIRLARFPPIRALPGAARA